MKLNAKDHQIQRLPNTKVIEIEIEILKLKTYLNVVI